MEFIGLALLSFFFTLAVPIIIIVVVVRFITHRRNGEKGSGVNRSVSELTPRQTVLGVLASAVIFAGATALYNLPTWLLNLSDDGANFGVRLVSGLLVLGLGLIVMRRRLIGTILMSLGVLNLLFAMPYIFSNFGSIGILILVVVVFAALIFFTLRLHKKGRTV